MGHERGTQTGGTLQTTVSDRILVVRFWFERSFSVAQELADEEVISFPAPTLAELVAEGEMQDIRERRTTTLPSYPIPRAFKKMSKILDKLKDPAFVDARCAELVKKDYVGRHHDLLFLEEVSLRAFHLQQTDDHPDGVSRTNFAI